MVRVYQGERIMTRQVGGGGGYLSQSSRTLHFGLGDKAAIDRAEGALARHHHVGADRADRRQYGPSPASVTRLSESQPSGAVCPQSILSHRPVALTHQRMLLS